MADPEVPETDPAATAEAAAADAGADPADPSAAPADAGADGTTAGADPAATDPTAAAEPSADDGPPYSLTFDHQCFLMDYIKDSSGAPLLEGQNLICPYKNFHALGASPGKNVSDLLAVFLGRGGMQEFLKIKPWQKALLQPSVRIWRVFPSGEGGGAKEEAEFQFQGFTSESRLSDLTTDSGGRAGGVGIKEFTWEFAGTNPAEGDKCIEVKMTMHFQSMRDLVGQSAAEFTAANAGTDEMASSRGGTPSFLELILHPEGGKAAATEYDPKFYQLKAVVGWAHKGANLQEHFAGEEGKKLLKQLKNMQLEMLLNLVEHEIKMKEDGSLDVTVRYFAAIETALESKAADILFPGGGSGDATVSGGFLGFGVDDRNVEDLDAEIEALEAQQEDIETAQSCEGEGAPTEEQQEVLDDEAEDAAEDLEELAELRAELHDENRTQAYASFTNALSGKIRHLDLDHGFLEKWQENKDNEQPELTSTNVDITIGDQGWFSNPESEAENADPSDVADDDIYYCYLGDIVEQACVAFDPENKAEEVGNMAIILGPAQYVNPRTKVVQTVSLADIPISYTMFLKFWNQKVVEPEVNSYSVRKFIMDVIQQLVTPALQPGCFPNASTQTGDVSRVAFTIKGSTDPLLSLGNRPTIEAIQAALPADINPEDPGFTYMLFYMQSGLQTDMQGNPLEDAKRGIYHYTVGEDSGLLKTIDFTKSDVQGLKEARQSEEGALSNLRELYNAKVKMVGNNIHFPGQYVFLNPPYGIGLPNVRGSPAFRLGLGGYHSVIKVRSSIKRGGHYNTELECVWVGSGAGAAPTETPPCGEVPVDQIVADSEPGFWESAYDTVVEAIDDVLGGDPLEGTAEDVDAEDPCEGEDNGAGDPWWQFW